MVSATSAWLREGRLRGAGEDHVVHAAGPHGLGGVGAHHPAQRLQQVRLAAAVRPDDAGDAGLDPELGRIDEGLEARKAQPLEVHGRSSGLPSCAAGFRRPVAPSGLPRRSRRPAPRRLRRRSTFLPLMKRVGVESTPSCSAARWARALTASIAAWSCRQASKCASSTPLSAAISWRIGLILPLAQLGWLRNTWSTTVKYFAARRSGRSGSRPRPPSPARSASPSACSAPCRCRCTSP